MTTLDLCYLAFIAIGLCLDSFVFWPAFLKRSRADSGPARNWMILFWVMVAAGCALWLVEGRAWGSLRLTVPHGWRLLVGIGLVLALVAANVPTIAKIVALRRSGKRIRMPGYADQLVPRTRSELGWWMAVSVTAGFCEEFIFRGYLIWVFEPVLGLWGAAALSLVVFATVHSYQGVKGVLAVGGVGAVFTLVVLILGSLWPAIVLHAVLDAVQGLIGWLVVRDAKGEGVLAARPPS